MLADSVTAVAKRGKECPLPALILTSDEESSTLNKRLARRLTILREITFE
jgi:hypothetical protein